RDRPCNPGCMARNEGRFCIQPDSECVSSSGHQGVDLAMTVGHVDERAPMRQWLVACAACVVGLTMAVVILRFGLRSHTHAPAADLEALKEDLSAIGTRARWTIGTQVIEKRLPRMDWTAKPGDVMGPLTLNGPIEADFNITLTTGGVHMAYV